MMRAVFEGGPLHDEELAFAGTPPSYVMMMRNPVTDSSMGWIVVGAGFDDHWPDQLRYDLVDEKLAPLAEGDDVLYPTLVYRYVEPGGEG